MKKVLITGATGMIGQLVLKYCLDAEDITKVVSISRRSTQIMHTKLEEILTDDFLDYDGHSTAFQNVDAAFFCIGVYTGSVSNEILKTITVDYTAAFGASLKKHSPQAVLSFLSGAGADLTEKSRTPFAKYKGMAENALMKLQFDQLYIFRPAYIYPVIKRKEPNLMYSISRSLYPLIRLFGKNASIPSTELAAAMVQTIYKQPSKEILENADILNYLELNQ
ncbi:MAG: epimerase [Saprospiraceae bacterium]